MRALRGLTVLGLALVMMGHTPGAWACSCAETVPTASFKAADVVFIGTASTRQDPNTSSIQSSGDPIVWTFSVSSVQKGTAASPVKVTSARDSTSCGFEFTIGKRYQVFAERSSKGLTTTICGGTIALVAGAKAFNVQSAGLAHTGRTTVALLLPLFGAAFVVAGIVTVRAARRRAVFTWPR